MIKIDMYNVKSKLTGLDTLPFNVINDVLASCSYVKKAFGVKPVRRYLIDMKSGITYTGLLSHIVPILKKNRIQYQIDDHRVVPEKQFNWKIVNGFTMRDYQKRIVDSVIKNKRALVSSCTSSGKAVTLDTPILTPNGFVPMADIHVGSIVYDENGHETTVTAEYPQGKKQVYRVNFADGTYVDCCENHLWKFVTKDYFPTEKRRWQVKTTKDILNSYKMKLNRGYNLAIPVCKPIEFEKKDLPIHPYLLGALLGDGSFTQSVISFTNTESDIVEKVRNLSADFGDWTTYPNHPEIQYLFRSGRGHNHMKDYIHKTFNHSNSYGKFIPEDYKMSSIEDRLEIVRGLVDTDGNVDADGHISYSSVSYQLAKDFEFIVRSLGYRTYFSSCDRRDTGHGLSYHVRIACGDASLFSSEKHTKKFENRNRHKRHYYDILKITSITKLDEYKEMKCITVNSSEHTFICKDFIVTHNTFMMANMMIAFGCKALVISPKASLSIQLRDEFEGFLGIKVGIINGNIVDYHNTDGTICPIVVGTPQSLLNHEDAIVNAEALLCDETHNLPARTIFNVAKKAVNAYYRCGVSGSPWRDDGMDIFLDAFAAKRNPHDKVSASELIANGTLTPVSIDWLKCDSGCGWLGDYATTYNKAIVNNEARNRKAVELAIRHIELKHPTLMLFQKTAHGKILLDMVSKALGEKNVKSTVEYNGNNYDVNYVELVDGTTSLDRREAVFKAIREGKTMCMIASTIADEGLSIKQLQVLIQCGGGKSTTRLFQRIGRVIRKCDGKDHAYVYDFVDGNDTMYLHSRTRYELIRLEPEFKQKVHSIDWIPEIFGNSDGNNGNLNNMKKAA